jgi:GDP-4-dehydro-6-deoxy-D-mannose reductase
MTLLVTGHKGFVGQHILNMCPNSTGLILDHKVVDILDYASVLQAIKNVKPKNVIHLAAVSFVPYSFEHPMETFQVNVLGTLNILLALRECDFKGSFLFVSSGDTYGAMDEHEAAIKETHLQKPRSPYAASKVSAEVLCEQFSLTEEYKIVIARPFNHIGPGQNTQFAVSSFAHQIAKLMNNKAEKTLKVGNLNVVRDFTDVRDIVSAYLLLLSEGVSGEVYNVCSGIGTHLSYIVSKLIEFSGVDIIVSIDQTRVRTGQQRIAMGNNAKIVNTTQWKTMYTLDQSLNEIFDQFREAEK